MDSSKDSGETKVPDIRAEGQLLQSLMMHWTHQDNLYWAQIRHLLILQLAALGTWYALGASPLNLIAMIVSALVSWRLLVLAKTISRNRDVNLPVIAAVSIQAASEQTLTLAKNKLGDRHEEKWGLIRLAEHSGKGKNFQSLVFFVCIFANLALCIPVYSDLYCGTRWLNYLHPKPPATTGDAAYQSMAAPTQPLPVTEQPDR